MKSLYISINMDYSAPVPTLVRVATQHTKYELPDQVPDFLTVVPKLTFDDPNSVFEKRTPVESPWKTAGSGGKWMAKDGLISLQHKGQMLEDSCRPEGTFRAESMLRLLWQIEWRERKGELRMTDRAVIRGWGNIVLSGRWHPPHHRVEGEQRSGVNAEEGILEAPVTTMR
jgi:hypothetical protein